MEGINKAFLTDAFSNIGYELSELQTEQFIKYYEMLVETNKVMNLTAITEYEDVVIKHFLDSGLLLKVCDVSEFKSLIDVGTGAGFPGIPLKILFPHLKVTLLDSLNKRIEFLKRVCNEINLENVDFVHGRAEDIGHDKLYRGQYDLCVSRAVANLSTLSEYCTPFIKIGGQFISYKSSNSDEEIEASRNAVAKLGCSISWIKSEVMPRTDIERAFVSIKREKVLAKQYPRKAGTPSKNPL